MPIEPQVFNVILYLIEHKDRVVSRQELLDTIWKDKVVSDSSISNYIKSARKVLGDNGLKQTVIKTIHGRGYQFTAILDGDEVGVTIKQNLFTRKPIYTKLILVCVILLLAVPFIKTYQNNQLYQAVENIAGFQETSYATFVAQVKRRDELVDMIESRTGTKREMQFEKLFSYYFNDMNDQERFVFDQIRAMTEVGLYQNNSKIIEVLKAYPEILHRIDGTKALQQHLIFWKNKYHSVFKQRKDMCLLYVGVEDGVPYPSHVNQNIKDWLKANR